MSHDDAHASSLRGYLNVARRRKWIILQALLIVPAAAVAFSLHQPELYRASAQVLLSSQNLAATLTGTQQTGIVLQPDRIAETQVDVARAHTVARFVLVRVPRSGLTIDAFLADSSVSASANADVLTFHVANRHPALAQRLVNAYATAYTVYRRQLDTASVANALRGVNRRLELLRAAGGQRSPLYASLLDRQQTLLTMQALQTANAAVLQQASGAAQVQPRPVRNGVLGLLLGLVLGIGLAFLWEALDTRVRTADQISARLGLPLLARIPEPPRNFRSRDRLVMLDKPTASSAEAFRVLRTNLEFARLDHPARTIMVTSAVEDEGKTTTISNLAIALARGGQRVVLVDLDLRRPAIHQYFGLRGDGLTQVALGHASLDQVLRPIALLGEEDAESGANGNRPGVASNGKRSAALRGVLEVLPSGPLPPDPGEFVGHRVLRVLLEQLKKRAEIVLIDAPPVLHVGDALTLSSHVDALFVVTRMKVVRRPMLDEVRRLLDAVPAEKLGFVVTGGGTDDGYGYGYGYGYARPQTALLPEPSGQSATE